MVAEEELMALPGPAVSRKLAEGLKEQGVACLAEILTNLGISTFDCLAKLAADEFSQILVRVRGAGFGPGHTCGLRVLYAAARDVLSSSSSMPFSDEAPPTAGLCEQLRAKLKAANLERMEAVVVQNGVRTLSCFASLSAAELEDVKDALRAAGFASPEIQAFAELPSAEQPTGFPGRAAEAERSIEALASSKHKSSGEDKENEERPRKILKSQDAAEARPSSSPYEAPSRSSEGEVLLERASKVLPSRLESVPLISDDRQRLTRQNIENTLCNSRAIQAEVVKYRDRVSGKLVEARIPSAVLALLRLRASCGGKTVSDLRLARMAADVMEEHAFDPVRAVAALSPSSILCPTGALRVLGSGFIGTVFLEEETGEVAKVMLDDFAKKEYDLCRAFATARLAPSPISLDGPCCVPGGELYCIRMERVTNTLHGVLCARGCRGLRHGLAPPETALAQRIGTAMVKAFQDMFDAGLVHGDLHLHNAGLKDIHAKPAVQLIDFGRSASKAACTGKPCNEAFRAGHEYDVCRFVVELCQAFDELQYEFEEMIQECQKELKDLRRTKEATVPAADWELHHARQIAGLQAFLEEEPKGLERAEAAFNAVLAAVLSYARVRLELPVEGPSSVRNRRVRQVCKKRENACHKVYFKSDLFWAEDM